MTKPDDVPQDVWDAAAECFAAGDWPLWLVDEERHAAHVSMARAIMAEREACALVAAGFNAVTILPFGSVDDNECAQAGQDYAADEIEARIRNRGVDLYQHAPSSIKSRNPRPPSGGFYKAHFGGPFSLRGPNG